MILTDVLMVLKLTKLNVLQEFHFVFRAFFVMKCISMEFQQANRFSGHAFAVNQ